MEKKLFDVADLRSAIIGIAQGDIGIAHIADSDTIVTAIGSDVAIVANDGSLVRIPCAVALTLYR